MGNVPEVPEQSQKNQSNSLIAEKSFLSLLLFFGSIIGLVLVLNYFNVFSLSELYPNQLGWLPHQLPKKSITHSPGKIIAKVGKEHIYQKDLDLEIQAYPIKNTNAQKLLMNKIMNDSIILQAGAKEGIIQLDQTVFDSSSKDSLKRTQLARRVKSLIEEKSVNISGTVITIWFYNVTPAPIGLEKGKELAFTKISKLHNDVVSKRLTIQQAAEEIRNDASLAQVDLQYKSNASFDFKVSNNKRITFSPEFDTVIRSLQPGQISPVQLVQDTEVHTRQKIDAVYMFAQVTEKKLSEVTGFDEWLKQHQKEYEVIQY